ncbi:hypothetical protein RLO43_002118 [Escherichia coli]|nr:hypothetical protein [Escherichia coli]
MFSQGGKGSTGILTNKQAVARHFGVKQSEVVYAKSGQSLSGYKVIYDKVSQRAYALPSNIGTVTVTSLVDGILTHSGGTVDLGALAVLREEYVTLVENFTSGFTIRVKNEVVSDGVSLYRWDGALPKTVAPGSTPETTGGVGLGAWLSVGDATLRSELTLNVSDINGLINVNTRNKNFMYVTSSFRGGGGAGVYVWNPTKNKSLHNGATIIDPSRTLPINWDSQSQIDDWFTISSTDGVGCFELIEGESSVNPLQWGCLGDSSKDNPHSGYDNSLISDYVDDYAESVNKTVFWPHGIFRFTGPQQRKTRHDGHEYIRMNSEFSTVFIIDNQTPITFLKGKGIGTDHQKLYAHGSRGIEYIGNPKRIHTLLDAYMYTTSWKHFAVRGFKYGFDINFVSFHIQNFYFTDNEIGIYPKPLMPPLQAAAPSTMLSLSYGAFDFSKNGIVFTERFGLGEAENVINVNLSSVVFEQNEFDGFSCANYPLPVGVKNANNRVMNLTVNNCWAELNGRAGFNFENADVTANSLRINEADELIYPAGARTYSIDVNGVRETNVLKSSLYGAHNIEAPVSGQMIIKPDGSIYSGATMPFTVTKTSEGQFKLTNASSTQGFQYVSIEVMPFDRARIDTVVTCDPSDVAAFVQFGTISSYKIEFTSRGTSTFVTPEAGFAVKFSWVHPLNN